MEEMAREYRGPHTVKVRRSPKNNQVVNHLIEVAKIATGSLLVVAAGDDISYPERSAILCGYWLATGAEALVSQHDEISETGRPIGGDLSFPTDLPGFCAAYRTAFWRDMPLTEPFLRGEDGLASWILRIRSSKVIRVPQTLMAYRLLSNSLSGRGEPEDKRSIWKRENRISVDANDVLERLAYVIKVESSRGEISKEILDVVCRDRRFAEIIFGFWDKSILHKYKLLLKARSAREFSFLIPRLFGRRTFQYSRIILTRLRNVGSARC